MKRDTLDELKKEAERLEEKLRAVNLLISLYAQGGESMADTVVPIKRRGRKAQQA